MYDAWTLLHHVYCEQNAMKEKYNELLKIVVKLFEKNLEEQNTKTMERNLLENFLKENLM